MKNVIFAIFFSIFSFSVVTESFATTVSAVCIKSEVVVALSKQTGEEIVWIGTIQRSDDLGTAALYVHPTTGTWSYVEHWQGYSCIIGGGDYSKSQLPKKQ